MRVLGTAFLISSSLAACQTAPTGPPSLQIVPPSYYRFYRIPATKKHPELIVMERSATKPDAIDQKKNEAISTIDDLQREIGAFEKRLRERN